MATRRLETAQAQIYHFSIVDYCGLLRRSVMANYDGEYFRITRAFKT